VDETLKILIQAGGAIGALGMVWLIVRALVPLFAKKHENGSKSAGRTANEWDAEIYKAAVRALLDTKAQRHEDLTKLFEKSLEYEFLKRNETLKAMLKELVTLRLDDLQGALEDVQFELQKLKEQK
jgi:hypothetical protein